MRLQRTFVFFVFLHVFMRFLFRQSIIVKGKSSGFKVTPERINFGTVKEGCSYSAHCSLRNVGITASRFAIKSLPASTGIKVIYTPSSVSYHACVIIQTDILN